MNVRERVARAWHAGADHAADEPFGGPLCNCDRVAGRIMPMLAESWCDGFYASLGVTNPYEAEEGRHVDQ